MLNKLNKRRGGFTLVEIMIVVAIIALLAAIAVPGFLRARKRSQASRILNDLRLIDSAVDQYAIETNKTSGATVNTADWTNYLKKNSVLIILTRLTSSPLLLPSRGDMHFYNDWAQRILHGQWSDHRAFYGLPGYPYLLALLYRFFGYSPFVPGFLQALLEGGTALLIYRLGLILFPGKTGEATPDLAIRAAANRGKIVGIIAAVGWAFFAPAQAYSVILMPTAWATFVFWFVTYSIVCRETPLRPAQYLLLGLLLGLTATAVATVLVLVPLALIALLFKRLARRALIVGAALFLLGVTAGTAPCWSHNYFVARDPVFLSGHSGINFWIGNNPDANGYPRFPPGLRAGQAAMLEDSIAVAESAAGRSLKRAEVSAYWSNKAHDYIAHHFFDWLKLLGTKLRNFWSAFQYDDLSIITNLREQGVILPGLYFGLVSGFALPGMCLAWLFAPRSRWIIAAIFLYMFSLLTVFTTERYRLPTVPGLLLMGTFGLFVFWESCARLAFRQSAICLVLLAGAVVFVSWPQRNPALWALDAYNSGWQALESNNLVLAERKLALAAAYVPDNAETNFAMGNLRLAQNRHEEAVLSYAETLKIDPNHKGALNNLEVIFLERGNIGGAQRFFLKSLKLDPHSAKTHFLLAKTALAIGDMAAAEKEIGEALKISPDQPEFLALKRQLEEKRSQP